MNSAPELPELALGLVAVAERAEGVECGCCQLELLGGAIAVSCPSECSSCELASPGCVQQGFTPLECGGRPERPLDGDRRLA